MRRKPTTGYSQRLQKALTEGPRPMSVRQLGREVVASGYRGRGASYGGIRQYVDGGVQHPRPELLEAISRTLGVRNDWLAWGEGAMTEDEQQALLEVEEVSEQALPSLGRAPRKNVDFDRMARYGAVALKFQTLAGLGLAEPGWSDMSGDGRRQSQEEAAFWITQMSGNVDFLVVPHWVPLVAEVRRRLGVGPVTIGRALLGVLEGLGLDPAEGVSDWGQIRPWLSDYIVGMVPVLLALEGELQRQRDQTAPDGEEE